MVNLLKVLASILGSLGLVLSIVANFHHFSTIFEENFFTVLIVSFVLSIAAAWPKSQTTKVIGPKDTYKLSINKNILRYRWIFIIVLISLGVGIYRYHIVHTKSSGDVPKINPGEIPLEPGLSIFSFPTASAQTQQNIPRLIQFKLRSEKTLFIETIFKNSLYGSMYAGAGINSLSKVYELSWELAKPIESGNCNQDFDAINALRALRAYASNNNKTHLLKYIESEAQLRSLKANHPDIVNALKPSRAEWSKLDRDNYYAILNWSRNCIGIFFPVFLITIENPSQRDILITEIRYDIKTATKFHGAIGVPSGPLTPTATYTHKIVNRVGIQSNDVAPPFRISPNSSGAFEIQLYLEAVDATQVMFKMNIEFITNQNLVKTESFFLVMAPSRS